jgi:uncharacterized membrane protein YgaE (UPF0421/DUF939 family)
MAMFRFANWRAHLPGVQLALRAATAAGVALGLAEILRLEYPIYALLAAVIATDLMPSQSRALGVRRIVATAVGAVGGAILSPLLPPTAWTLALSILVAMLACEIFNARDAAKVAGYICGIVVLDHSAEPWLYSFFRFAETVLGVVAAWAVSYVPKLMRTDMTNG